MILLLVCLCVPASLFFWWRLCAVASDADDRMEAGYLEMLREKYGGSQAVNSDPFGKEAANAG